MTYILTWLIAILAALRLWFMPVQYESNGGDVKSDPPLTITFIGEDVSEP